MTGYKSKRAAALDEDGMYLVHHTAQPAQEPDVVMHWASHTWTTLNPPPKGSGDVNLYYAPAPAAPVQPAQERNFCAGCGKRTADLTVIHTCTPPQKSNA
jgi:hypothetical protein